jgi:hypothetical protein
LSPAPTARSQVTENAPLTPGQPAPTRLPRQPIAGGTEAMPEPRGPSTRLDGASLVHRRRGLQLSSRSLGARILVGTGGTFGTKHRSVRQAVLCCPRHGRSIRCVHVVQPRQRMAGVLDRDASARYPEPDSAGSGPQSGSALHTHLDVSCTTRWHERLPADRGKRLYASLRPFGSLQRVGHDIEEKRVVEDLEELEIAVA